MEKKFGRCLCGSYESTSLFSGRNFEVVRCTKCGLCRTVPAPELHRKAGAAKELKRNIQREILWRKFAKQILNEVTAFKKKGVLLDVGCAEGILVDEANKQGFDAIGVEIDASRVRYAHKFVTNKVINENFEDFNPERKFDVITMNHVIEHLKNPKSFLARAVRMLEDDGILVIGAPNIDGAMRTVLGSRWYPYSPEEHFWHFSPKTLINLMKESGFREERVRLLSINYRLLMPLALFFEKIGMGDSILAIFSKA